MTRLIDADALRQAFHKRIYYFNKSSWDEANGIIDNAPTVEERPKGKWIDRNGDTWCANCQKDAIYLASGRYLKTDFCPHCGADMRGDYK